MGTKAFLILVAGLPGSGKSYFAEHLASQIDANYISSDQVRIAEQASGQYTEKDKLRIYDKIVNLVESFLKNKRKVIVDATFYRQSIRDLFFNLAKMLDLPVIFIEVFADEDIIKERVSKSRKYSEADFEVYKKVKDSFEKINEPHLRLKSTNDNLQNMLHSALQYINSQDERK